MANKIRLSLWLVLVFTVAACATTPDGYQRDPNGKLKKSAVSVNSIDSGNGDQQTSEFITRPVAGETGMIYIERRTKEYSISMVLDASDENVYFVMDLPQEELVEKEELSTETEVHKKPEPEQEESKELAAEEMKDSPEELTAVEEPEIEAPIEEEITSIETAVPLPENRNEARASKYVLYAQTYFFEKKYARALEEIKRAIEYSPDSGVAHSLKGSINYKMGDINKARSSWEEALKLDASLDNVEKMLKQLDEMEVKESKSQGIT